MLIRWRCLDCGSSWAPGAPCCPACRSLAHVEEAAPADAGPLADAEEAAPDAEPALQAAADALVAPEPAVAAEPAEALSVPRPAGFGGVPVQ